MFAELKLRFNLLSAENFETNRNDSDLEQRDEVLNVFLQTFEELHFSLDRNWTIIVKQAAENMSDFDDRAHLSNILFHNSVQNFLEEVQVVIKLEGKRELVLEVFPDLMVFTMSAVRLKTHL